MLFEFIKNHYEIIISILLVLTSFILTLVKKKPVINKIDEIKAKVLELLPGIIAAVETPGNGSTKKNLVLKQIQLLIAKDFGFYDFASIEAFISEAIENILKTPQKKED